MSKTLSVADVAELYGVTQATVCGWLTSGQLRGFNVGRDPKKRPKFRIREDDLRAFEEARAAGPKQSAPPRRRRQKSVDIDQLLAEGK